MQKLRVVETVGSIGGCRERMKNEGKEGGGKRAQSYFSVSLASTALLSVSILVKSYSEK